MRFTTKTEYGLFCLIFMAQHQAESKPVTVKDVVTGENYSQTYTEKILQGLRSANIVSAVHGHQGGYVLARHPSQITLREIVDALEGQTFDVFCEPDIRKDIVCNHFPSCTVKQIWDKTKVLLDRYYGTITLEMLAKNEVKSPDAVDISK